MPRSHRTEDVKRRQQLIGANSSPRGCIVSPSSRPAYSGEAFSSLFELRPFDNLANTQDAGSLSPKRSN